VHDFTLNDHNVTEQILIDLLDLKFEDVSNFPQRSPILSVSN